MAKKEASGKHAHAAHAHHEHVHTQAPHPHYSLEEKMVHNLVELQKIHTDLAEKFDKLSTQITHLLNLFEMSAHAFAKQNNMPGMDKDREFLDKIDKLLEQNKLIAKGLTLMEDKMRERLYGGVQQNMNQGMPPRPSEIPRQLPRF